MRLKLQLATGAFLLVGLLVTTVHFTPVAWGAEPRVLEQSRVPTTIQKRLDKIPYGPITSYFRALTLFDPDMEFFEVFNSQSSNSTDLEELTSKFLNLYGVSESEKANFIATAEANYKKWTRTAKAWRKYITKKQKQMTWVKRQLLPDTSSVNVEPDMALSVPLKTSYAMKSIVLLESLRTLQTWPGEVVISTGIQPSLKEVDFPLLLTMIYVLYRYYSTNIPSTVTLKFVAHTHDAGPWSSRYTGIKMTQAPLIALMDADDYLNPLSIDVRAKLLKELPDLDYLLGGLDSITFEKNATMDKIFSEQLFPLTLAMDANSTGQKMADEHRPYINEHAFEETFNEFNFTRRNTFSLGSIISVPNLGTQWYRYHDMPFMDLIDEKRKRVDQLRKEHRLPELGYERYMDKTDRGAFRGFLANRERQDREYLQREIEQLHDQDWDKRCHNAWSAGRREVYETIPPPVWQWNGEDSAFNFMVYGARLNAACISFKIGGYTFWDDEESLFRVKN